jgi:tagaturonate epimerase
MTMLTPLSLTPSFGFGDRLGLATPGHIAAARGTGLAPIFAQQSVRENARTGRTPQQVLDDARRAVEAAGWDAPWGADADHLKSPDDLPPFVQAGYTFFTVDPGAHVDNAAAGDPLPVLKEKARGVDMEQLNALYLHAADHPTWGQFDSETLLRAAVKYGRAIEHTVTMYRRLAEMKDAFDFEVSVDETDAPTTPLEHFFIVNELTRRGVHFTSLAPRFVGRFEKGVDYVGNLAELDAEMARHAAVTAHFGTYKISLHSGSDKFSVYPLLAKHWGKRIHVKTAGTSYLEALRTVASLDPALFQEIYSFARERYEDDKVSYHVSAELKRAPLPGSVTDWPALLDQFDAREILHVTFGSVLTDKTAAGEPRFYTRFMTILKANPEAYAANLKKHFARHLKPFTVD